MSKLGKPWFLWGVPLYKQNWMSMNDSSLITRLEGWIAPQLDINEKRRQNKELMALYIDKVAGERSAKEAKAMWPFFTET
ncbi:hypothetical protein N7476_004960 [Penicillium atrosanguineum]|uniref:Uncharacterized protein n=1 Tax=Penicillium atrosanguineum TaxID=1132637 RepID=A0A9W9Q1Q4_9EURO|nr:hypothetical protein N7526_001955 [Penicillium atrosanguineum]KAJ5318540.1 hypothetical protein N7476_004960 [Penicillium atrosanguineum]